MRGELSSLDRATHIVRLASSPEVNKQDLEFLVARLLDATYHKGVRFGMVIIAAVVCALIVVSSLVGHPIGLEWDLPEVGGER